ncbi:MAG: oligoribonuclease [Bdellovibrionales bacterium]|nr:oligoribonuclease [Bdellovibrionales bacterium]
MIKLLWVDLEMTGLDVEKEVIIEAAAVVTNNKLETLDQYHAVVKQPQIHIDRMDAWNQKHHKESGLVDLIPTGKDPEVVENELMALIEKNFDPKDRIILAGNSIGQDRLFINKYFSKVAARLHYRMLDVTSFKVVFNNFYQISYAKPQTQHRASADIQESINELKRYLSFVKI